MICFFHLLFFFHLKCHFYFIFFSQNNAVGGENKNKILQRHFYFYLDFQKNRVGSPENQKIQKNLALVVLFIAVLLQIFWRNFYSNAPCFSLLWLYLGNSQVSVYRTIGPALVLLGVHNARVGTDHQTLTRVMTLEGVGKWKMLARLWERYLTPKFDIQPKDLLHLRLSSLFSKLISHIWLILSYTVQAVILDVCTKFKILCQVVPEKSLTKISILITLD